MTSPSPGPTHRWHRLALALALVASTLAYNVVEAVLLGGRAGG